MSDEHQPPETSAPGPTMLRRSLFTAALPYICTAVVAVLCSLLLQALLWPRPAVTLATAPTATATPAIVATPAAVSATPAQSPVAAQTAAPAPTAAILQADERVLRLEILDLEEENRHVWSALYLLRASSQLDDAARALQANEFAEVDRTLLTARRSLDRAYAFSAEQEKGPIDTFRLQISQIRDDMRVRPEGLDRRLRQLRQLVLSLVDEGGA